MSDQSLLDTLTSYMGSSAAQADRDYLEQVRKGEHTQDNIAETVLKYGNIPNQWLAAAAAKTLTPNYIANKFNFAVPERASEQKGLGDLGLALSGKSREDIFRDPTASAAFGIGLIGDIVTDPVGMLIKPFRLTRQAALLEKALSSTYRAPLQAAQNLTREAGKLAATASAVGLLHAEPGKLMEPIMAALRAGKEVITPDAATLEAAAKGQRLAVRAVEDARAANAELRGLFESGAFDKINTDYVAKRLIEQKLGLGRTERTVQVREGMARLPFTFGSGEAGSIEKGVAKGIGWLHDKTTGAIAGKLKNWLDVKELDPALQYMRNQFISSQKIKDDRAIATVDGYIWDYEEAKRGHAMTTEQRLAAIEQIREPIVETLGPEMYEGWRAYLKSPRYGRVEALAETEVSLAERSIGGVDAAYFTHRNLPEKEAKDALAVGRGDFQTGPGRSYRTADLDTDQAALVRKFYRDMRGRVGFGNAAVVRQDGQDALVVRKLAHEPVGPAELTDSHFTQLERVLAIAGQRGWGLRPNADLSKAIEYGRIGSVQVVDPTIFEPYGSNVEAWYTSRAVAMNHFANSMPGSPPTFPLLSDPKTAAKVVPIPINRSVLDVKMELARKLNPDAKLQNWDRAVLASQVQYVNNYPTPQIEQAAREIQNSGTIPIVRVMKDPDSGFVYLADEASHLTMRAAEYGERTAVTTQWVDWIGEVGGRVPKKYEAAIYPAMTQRRIYNGIESLRREPGPVMAERLTTLRSAGMTDQALQALVDAHVIDEAGKPLVTFEATYAKVRSEIDTLRKQVFAELQKVAARNPNYNAQAVLDAIFPPAGSTANLSLARLKEYLDMSRGTKEAGNISRRATRLGSLIEGMNRFLVDGDVTALGRTHAFLLQPSDGAVAVRTLGALVEDYPTYGAQAAAKYLADFKMAPQTPLHMVKHDLDPGLFRGAGQKVALSTAGDTTNAYSALAMEDLKTTLAKRGKIPRFQATKEQLADLAEQGIHINPKKHPELLGVIPDKKVIVGFHAPGGNGVLGIGQASVDELATRVYGAVPHPMQEFWTINQGGVTLHNLQYGLFDKLSSKQVQLLNERLKHLAQWFVDAGLDRSKSFSFSDTIPMDWRVRERLFGDTTNKLPTLGEVASGEYKVKLPANMEGTSVDLANPLTGAVYTVRASTDSIVNMAAEAYNKIVKGDLLDQELAAKLMLPKSVRYGYFGRVISPEARMALDAFNEAIAKQDPSGPMGKLYGYLNQHYKGRTFTQLTEREINDLFTEGKVVLRNGKPLTREDLLTVKLSEELKLGDGRILKKGATVFDVLQNDGEALAFFVNDVRHAMLVRVLAGQRSLRNAGFLDATKLLAMPLWKGEDGLTPTREVPVGVIRKLMRRAEEFGLDTLRPDEQDLVNLTTKPGRYQATITEAEARKLIAAGELPLDAATQISAGDSFVHVEGRLFSHPRWRDDSAVRFMPRETLAEINSVYRKFTDAGALGAILKGWHGLQNMWKRQALYLTPKYYVRNIIGNIILAWQGGLHPGNMETYSEALGTIRGYNQYTRYSKEDGLNPLGQLVLKEGGRADVGLNPSELVVTKAGTSYSREQLMELALENDVFGNSYHAELRDVPSAQGRKFSDTLAGRGIPSLNDMSIDKAWEPKFIKPVEDVIAKGKKLNETIENYFKFAVFLQNVKDGQEPVQAAMTARKVLGGALPLSTFERDVATAVFPFYRWLRFNIPRQVTWHMERPDQVWRMWRALDIIGRGGADVPENELPEWVRDNFKVTLGKKDGKWAFFLLDGLLPPFDLYRMRRLAAPAEFTGDVVLQSISPLIRTPAETAMNRTLEGIQIESVPGQLSDMAFGKVPLPNMTRAITTQGPLKWGNLVYNEQLFNTLRPIRELSKLTEMFHRSEEGWGSRLRNYLVLTLTESDPVKQMIFNNHERQQIMTAMRAKYAQAVREENDAKAKYWLGQINRHSILENPE